MTDIEPRPDASPAPPPVAAWSWRVVWKYVAVGSLSAGIGFTLASTVFNAYQRDHREAAWFLIVDGMLGLGELVCFAIATLSAIAWFMSRHSSK